MMETREVFRLSMSNMEWLADNYENLRREYDGRWIAVSGARVVESSRNLEKLKEAIAKCVDRDSIVVEFMTTEPIAMFF